MKKIVIIILFTGWFNKISSQSQLGKAYYSITSNFKLNKVDEKQKLVFDKILDKNESKGKNEFILSFNKGKSLFYAENSLEIGKNKIDLTSIKSKIIGKIYMDYVNKISIQEKEKFGEIFNIRKVIEIKKWIITKETRKFGEYTCFKAILNDNKTKKNETIAWFAPSIPLNIGPLGYYGLPGLIVVLEEDVFLFTLKRIEFLKNNTISIPTKGKKVSDIEYDSIYKSIIKQRDLIENKMYNKN